MAFLGFIIDQRLKVVFLVPNDSILEAIKMALGDEFLVAKEHYHINTNILSRFVVSLLDLGGSRSIVLVLV